jgi:hypothetical protein
MVPTFKTQRDSHLLCAGGLAALLLGGCASVPPPTASLAAAQQAITTAEAAEAPRYAAAELASSRAKLLAAGTAVTSKDMIAADRLAQESRVEAEYANAKSLSARATLVNDEMRKSSSALVEEMNRKAGDAR